MPGFGLMPDSKMLNGRNLFSQITVVTTLRPAMTTALTPIPDPDPAEDPNESAHSSHLGNELLALYNLARKSVLNSLANAEGKKCK